MRDLDILRLRPGTWATALAAERLLVVADGKRYLVEDLEAEDFAAIVEAVDGQRTVADLVEYFDEDYEADSLRWVLQSLVGKALEVTPAGDATPEYAQGTWALGALPRALREQRVGVFASGALGRLVVQTLADAGFDDVQWYDVSALAEAHSNAFRSRMLVGRLPEASASAIGSVGDGRAGVVVSAGPEDGELAGLCRDRDVILCCVDGTSHQTVLDINRASLDSETPCYFIVPEARHLVCGPLLMPWRTGCFECSRLTANCDLEGTIAMAGTLADGFAPPVADAPEVRLAVHTAMAIAWRQLRGVFCGRPYPDFHSLERIGFDGTRSTRKYEPTTLCGQCAGLNRGGLTPAAALRVPAMSYPLQSRAIVDTSAGTRCFTAEQALSRARSAQEKLGLEFSLTSIPANVLARFPGLAELQYIRTRAFPSLRATSPMYIGEVRDSAFGKGPDPGQAKCSGVFEWYERHLSAYHGRVEVVRAPYREVVEHAMDLPEQARYALPTDRPAFAPEVPIDWVWGYSISRKRPILLPAALVFLGGGRLRGTELSLPNPGSTGISAGSNREEAFLQGLLEAVEHDAWFSTWRTASACRQLDLDSVDDDVSRYWIEVLTRAGFSLRVRDLTSDTGIPMLEATLQSTDEVASWSQTGFGSSLSPAIALRRAITEAFQVLCAIGGHAEGRLERRGINGVYSARSHLERQLVSNISTTISWKEIANPQPSSNDIMDHIDTCIAMIQNAVPEAEICLYDFSLPEVPEIAVVRAFVTCVQDQVKYVSHVRPRMTRYQQVVGQSDAEAVAIQDMYLGEIA